MENNGAMQQLQLNPVAPRRQRLANNTLRMAGKDVRVVEDDYARSRLAQDIARGIEAQVEKGLHWSWSFMASI